MKVNHLPSLALLATMLLIGCQKDLNVQDTPQPKATDQSQYYEPSKAYLASLEALTKKSNLSTRAACHWIELAAGSIDALAQAVNDACEGGVIYFKAGTHTENKAITITKRLYLVGEAGAVLKFKSQLSQLSPSGTMTLNPSLHFNNAPQSAVLNLAIQTLDSDGSTAILFENSNESAVINSKITQFQSAIMVEQSDRVAIMRNTVVGSSAWKTGAAASGESIVVINGKSVYISDNDVSNAVFPIWPCDKWGTCERNYTHDSFLGIILCNVPAGGYILPSGKAVGALSPTTGYKVRDNNSTDNLTAGYLVIDGANNNIIENNNAARNGTYDMELTTDTYRFGFLTPKSYNNTVNAGAYQNIRIKNCGENNTVVGGVQVNTATDPCN